MLSVKTTLTFESGRDGWCFLHRAQGLFTGATVRRMHSHDELELNIGVSGKGRYLVDGRSCDVSPGVLLRLLPEQAHLLIEESPDFSMWVAVIRTGAVPEHSPENCFCAQSSFCEAEFLLELCRQLAEAESAEIFNTGLRFLFLRAGALIAGAEGAALSIMHPAVVKAARLMKQPECVPDVETIARKSGMSRSQLSRLFKKQTGFTLVEYRQKMQLERFLFLYGAGLQRNVMEAALEAGFGSYAQFYRIFVDRFKKSPRDYFGAADKN